MPTCSVPYCLNATKKNSRLTFHEFPHETPLFMNKWIQNIGRANWRPGVRSLVCSEHFEKDDFDRQGRLRIGSFPSKFPEPPHRKKRKETEQDSSDHTVGQTNLTESVEDISECEAPLDQMDTTKTFKKLKDSSSVSQNSISTMKKADIKDTNENIGSSTEDKGFKVVKITHTLSSKSPSDGIKLPSNSLHVKDSPKKRKITIEPQLVTLTKSPDSSALSSLPLKSCLICGMSNNSNVDIFGGEGKRLNLLLMVKKCLPIQLNESDALPHHLCEKCISSLKSCNELISLCEKTNSVLKGKSGFGPDQDTSILYSKPTSSQANKRLLLLELTLIEGIPVKSMMTQAIQELSLRLQPKESRLSKPQGRIMFLDLQGGGEAFPEQLKKAISMLYPGPHVEHTGKKLKQDLVKVPSNKKNPAVILPKESTSIPMPKSTMPPLLTLKAMPPKMSSSCSSPNQTAPKLMPVSVDLVPSSNTSPNATTPKVVPVSVGLVPSPSTSTNQTTPKLVPVSVALVPSSNSSANLATPKLVPVSGFASSPNISVNQTTPTLVPVSVGLGPSPNTSANQTTPKLTPIGLQSANMKSNQTSPLLTPVPLGLLASPNIRPNQITPTLTPVPLGLLPESLLPSTVRFATLPHTVPPTLQFNLPYPVSASSLPQFNVSQILNLPSQAKCNVIKIVPKGNPSSTSVNTSAGEAGPPETVIMDDKRGSPPPLDKIALGPNACVKHVKEVSPLSVQQKTKEAEAAGDISRGSLKASITSNKPSEVLKSSGTEGKPKGVLQTSVFGDKSSENLNNVCPILDIAKMKERVLTRINNKGNQFKLGDKIVGIVVRNTDTPEEIQKKLQATLSKSDQPTTGKRKLIPIQPKVVDKSDALEVDDNPVDKSRRLKDPALEICPVSDNQSSFFDRRCARKLSLSFMWRKSKYLVSSYQKLFTWIVLDNDSDDASPVLSCRVCKFVVKDRSDVENHLQTHPDLQCCMCSKYFLTVGKVQEHLKVIHQMSLSSDLPKKRSFVSWRQNTLKRTFVKHYQCSRCERRFKMKSALTRHTIVCKEKTLSDKIVAITNSNLLCCPICNRSFPSNTTMQDHMLVHAKRTSWLCDVCGMVLKSQSNYRSHVARHDEKAHEFKYQCSYCKKRFKLENRYLEHIKKHEVQQQFICSSCGKVFHSSHGLRQHEILHGERKFQCRYCPSRFHRRDHLRHHESSHNKSPRSVNRKGSPKGSRLFSCRFCPSSPDTKFSNMRLLMKHYQDDHDLERGNIPGSLKYSCDRCNRTFLNSTLLRHHHMWHAGLRPYYCSVCNAGFMVKERLRNHELTHTNERPYKCQTCDKGFRSKNCLKQHKLIHKDPSDFYKCSFCDRAFSRIDNLRTHTRVHTGEKPWKCLQCQKEFRLRSDCTKHIHIVHKVPQEEIQNHIETLFDPLGNTETPVTVANDSNPSIEAAIAGITSVQTVEILLDDDMIEAC